MPHNGQSSSDERVAPVTILIAAAKTGRWDWPVVALEELEKHGWQIVPLNRERSNDAA